MKVAANLFRVWSHKPQPNLIENVSVEEIIMEDVEGITIDDNNLHVHYNDGSSDSILLRANDGQESGDWRGINLFITRKMLKIDMSK